MISIADFAIFSIALKGTPTFDNFMGIWQSSQSFFIIARPRFAVSSSVSAGSAQAPMRFWHSDQALPEG